MDENLYDRIRLQSKREIDLYSLSSSLSLVDELVSFRKLNQMQIFAQMEFLGILYFKIL